MAIEKSNFIRKNYLGRISAFALMLIFSIAVIYPFLVMVFTALKPMQEIMQPGFTLLPQTWMFVNFRNAMASAAWDRFFFNSMVITVASVLFALTFNSLAGYAFARLKFRGRDTLFLLALVGMMIPTQVTMLPNFIIMANFPLAGGNNILGQGGTGFINTYTGLLAPYIAGAFGVFLFRQYFLTFPQSLDDAAKIDRLGRFGAFIYIYLPLSKPVFATLAVFRATSTWNDYMWPLIITPQRSMWTVQLALQVFQTEFTTEWHYLMASTTLIVLPLFVLYLFTQRYFVEGIATTGMKG
jgi:multiple sugar transport system permease protein